MRPTSGCGHAFARLLVLTHGGRCQAAAHILILEGLRHKGKLTGHTKHQAALCSCVALDVIVGFTCASAC
jgi:hypothetical protein